MERLPPHDLEAEQAMVGSLLLDRDAVAQATISPRDFWHGANGLIYDAIVGLYARQEPTDLITLTAELTRRHHLEAAGGVAYVTQLLSVVPTAVHFPYYQDIVREKSLLRDLIDVGANIVRIGYNESQASEVAVAEANALLQALSGKATKPAGITYEDAAMLFAQEIEERWAAGATYELARVLPTGFHNLDRMLGGGFGQGEAIVIAGRPGAGKSAMMLQLAHNVARRELILSPDPRWTLIFSSEMTLAGLVWRALAEVTRIPSGEIKAGFTLSPERKDFVRQKVKEMARLPIWIDDTSQPTTDQIKQRTERFAMDRPLGMVMFDYLQQAGNKTRGKDGNNEQRVAGVSLALKHLAKSSNIPVVELAQLNRTLEGRSDKHPIMADLRDSGQIEQDADKILFLYNQDYYESQGIPIEINAELRGMTEIEVAKNRDGAPGKCRVRFLRDITAFENAA